MSELSREASVGFYLLEKWSQEDDDGINIIIIDDRRKRLERLMLEHLKRERPERTDEHGNQYYSIAVLDQAWAGVTRA